MTNYELTYIVSNQYTEEELENIKVKVDGVLAKYGATIGHQDSLGKKRLAYPIGQVATGYYMITEFELEDKEGLKKINNELKLDKEIVRSLVISKPKITREEINRIEQKKNKKSTSPEPIKTAARPATPTVPEPEKEPVKKVESVETRKSDKRVSIEKLDEKIDEILQDDNIL